MVDCSLKKAPVGQTLTITDICGGRSARLRLATMGLREGAHIRLARNVSNGPVIIEVGNGRLALGSGIAEKVQVTATISPPMAQQTTHDHNLGFEKFGKMRFS